MRFSVFYDSSIDLLYVYTIDIRVEYMDNYFIVEHIYIRAVEYSPRGLYLNTYDRSVLFLGQALSRAE